MCELAVCLVGLYLEASAMIIAPRGAPPRAGEHWIYDRNATRNPYGTIALGYLWQARSGLEVFVEIRHESALPTPLDLGEDSVRAGARWFPFARSAR